MFNNIGRRNERGKATECTQGEEFQCPLPSLASQPRTVARLNVGRKSVNNMRDKSTWLHLALVTLAALTTVQFLDKDLSSHQSHPASCGIAWNAIDFVQSGNCILCNLVWHCGTRKSCINVHNLQSGELACLSLCQCCQACFNEECRRTCWDHHWYASQGKLQQRTTQVLHSMQTTGIINLTSIRSDRRSEIPPFIVMIGDGKLYS